MSPNSSKGDIWHLHVFFSVHISHSHISVIAACTFLGLSRKHKPRKDSIDAIEARLHQTEVLVGIMLASCDPRTQSPLQDIVRNPAAHKIIARVDASPYGVKGRRQNFMVPITSLLPTTPSTNGRMPLLTRSMQAG